MLVADRRFPPALGISLLAHLAIFLAFRPPVPDVMARHVSQIIDVRFAVSAPLPEFAPQPPVRPRPVRARQAPLPEPLARAERPAPAKETAPAPAEPAMPEEAAAAPAEPSAPVPSETAAAPAPSAAPPAAPIAEAQYEVQGLNNPKPPYPLAARRQGLEDACSSLRTCAPTARAAT